jgi:transposase-like protein
LWQKKPVDLSGEVETDGVYITAGHKGYPAILASKNRIGRRRKLTGKCGWCTLAEEKPPVLGMIQRNGEVVIKMLPNVQQVTIQPVMTQVIKSSSLIYTDEYNIYDRLEQ